MKKLTMLLTAVCGLSILNANAHERFMLPSHTLLSGDEGQYVTLTASISNDIFHPDRPFGNNDKGIEAGDMRLLYDILQETVLAPDGKSNDVSWQAFHRLSVADVKLAKSGTYRISQVQPDVHMTTYTTADGGYGRVFGKNPKLPDGITKPVRRTTSSRVETFVTLNEPNLTAVKATGSGLEIAGKTHPNDLFAGEEAQFQLLFQGKALPQNAKVKIIRGGTRHRNDREEQIVEVEKDGVFSFMPKYAGFYLLSAELAIDIEQPAAVDVKHYGLMLTLEVFPE